MLRKDVLPVNNKQSSESSEKHLKKIGEGVEEIKASMSKSESSFVKPQLKQIEGLTDLIRDQNKLIDEENKRNKRNDLDNKDDNKDDKLSLFGKSLKSLKDLLSKGLSRKKDDKKEGIGLLEALGLSKLMGSVKSGNFTKAILGFGKAFLKKFFAAFLAIDFLGTIFSDEKLKEITGKENNTFYDKFKAGLASILSLLTFGIFGSESEIFKAIDRLPEEISKIVTQFFTGEGDNKVVKEMHRILDDFYDNFLSIASWLTGFDTEDLRKNFSIFFSKMKGFVDFISGPILEVFENIKNTFSDAVDHILKSVREFFQIGVGIFTGESTIGELLESVWSNIVDLFLIPFKGLTSMLDDMFGTEIFGTVYGVVDKFATFIKEMFGYITGKIDQVANFLGIKTDKMKAVDKFREESVKNSSSSKEGLKANDKFLNKKLEESGLYTGRMMGDDDLDWDKIKEAGGIDKRTLESLLREGDFSIKDTEKLWDLYQNNGKIVDEVKKERKSPEDYMNTEKVKLKEKIVSNPINEFINKKSEDSKNISINSKNSNLEDLPNTKKDKNKLNSLEDISNLRSIDVIKSPEANATNVINNYAGDTITHNTYTTLSGDRISEKNSKNI